MNPLTLYSGPLSMFGMQAHIAALEKGLDVELILVAYSDEHGYHPKHPEVCRINPKRQVPVLVHGDLEIFDSTQIFEFFEDLMPSPALWPPSPAHCARARLLEHLSDEVFFPHIVQLMGLQEALDSSAATEALTAAARYYQEMEQRLDGRSYLAGHYSYADIAFFMAQVFAERMGAVLTEGTPALMAWREEMVAKPAVRQALEPMVVYLVSQGRPVPDFL